MRQYTTLTAGIIVCVVLCFPGCQEKSASPTDPADQTELQKPGNGKGKQLVTYDVTVEIGDSGLLPADHSLETTCAGTATSDNYKVYFYDTQCLIVTPKWLSSNYNPYELTDDIVIGVNLRKGKLGDRLDALRIWGQDIAGTEGIMHRSEIVVFDTPVSTDPESFTLHVHARDVPIWRLKGLLSGKPVEVIGTVSIGDIVYSARP